MSVAIAEMASERHGRFLAVEPEHLAWLLVGLRHARQIRTGADRLADGNAGFVRRPIEGHESLPGEDFEGVLRVLLEFEVDEFRLHD